LLFRYSRRDTGLRPIGRQKAKSKKQKARKARLDFIEKAGERRDQKLLFAFCGSSCLPFAVCFL
jgi:hypothetical protein